MKKKNLLILSITALSAMVMGSCGTTPSAIDSTPTSQNTSGEATTSDVSSQEISSEEISSAGEISSEEESSEEVSSTPVEETFTLDVITNQKVAVTLDKTEAKAGELVTVTLGVIAEDNALVKIEVLTADSTAVEIVAEVDGTFTFTMPEANVSVQAITREFEVNSIVYRGDDNISISGEESVKEGEVVSVKVSFSEGFALDAIEATSGEDTIELTKISPVEYSFVMPKGAVDVNATSKTAEANKYSEKTYRGSIIYDDESLYGLQMDYQLTFGVNTLSINSSDNSGEYTKVVFASAPYFYDETAQQVTAYTGTKTYVFADDGSDKLVFEGGFEIAYLPTDDSSSFSAYYARSQVYTNVDFELELSYPAVDATSPIQNSEYTFGVLVKSSYAADYMVGAVKVVKRGDSSVEVPVTDNHDGTYTITVPEFNFEINAEAVELIDLVGHKYNLTSYYYDSWTDETISYDMSLELFENGVADFEYSSDISSDDISASDASYLVDSVNRTISVDADGDNFEFALVNSSDINQIKLTSKFLDLDSVKLSDRKFQVSLVSNDHVSLALVSNSPAFQNEEKEFTLSVDEGYEFKDISAADALGNAIDLTVVVEGSDYKLDMPYSNVLITVTIEEIQVDTVSFAGIEYTGFVYGYTDFYDNAENDYERCGYLISFDFISETEVVITAGTDGGSYLYGDPDSVNETVSYAYDASTSRMTIDGNSSKTLTYNEDGTLTCNYKISPNIDGSNGTTLKAPVVIPVSGKSYSASTYGGNDEWEESPYDCTFDFISDTQVHITLEIGDWSTGDSVDQTVSYAYDSSTKTITIDGNSTKTLTLNDDGSLTCNYKVGNYVDFRNEVFGLDA